MVKKFGIKYKPTDEWVVCSNADKNYLFTADETKIKAALTDILYSSGNHNHDGKDFEIQSIEAPEEYDGSGLLDGEIVFVDPELVENNLVMKNVFKDYGPKDK